LEDSFKEDKKTLMMKMTMNR